MNKFRAIQFVTRCLATLLLAASAHAVDLASSPLVTSAPSEVKPNLMFVLDDSGSMDWDFLPDWANDGYCRASGATGTSSGTWNRTCCQTSSGNVTDNNACWHTTTTALSTTRRAHPPFLSKDFNGVAYNPAVTYTPPKKADGSSGPSQTSANTSGWSSVKNDAYNVQNTASINLLTGFPDTEWCTSTAYTDCLRNGNYVLPGTVDGKNYTTFRATTADGSGLMAVGSPDAATTVSRNWGPHYYSITPSEYCDAPNLRNCQQTPSVTYSYPAPLRWCNSDANARAATPAANSCQAVQTTTYNQARYPTKYRTPGAAAVAATPGTGASVTFTVTQGGTCNGSNQVSYSAVTAGAQNLISATTVATTGNNAIATNLRDRINNRSPSLGFVASGSGNSITITAPVSAGNITSVLTLTRAQSNSCTVTIGPATPATKSFSGYVAPTPAIPAVPAGYPGAFVRTDIVPSVTSYPKAATRSDCAGATCTYAEEMTNFANWWTYYHTRMQMMKSSTALAFSPVTDKFRVGYLSINNSTNSDFLNLAPFADPGKTNWYDKLAKAKPNSSTPLRTALSTVGRLYAGKLNGNTLNGSTVLDPMQYSCQRNFTLLSTDGFWNESATPRQVDGSTAIGNQDGSLDRPMLDGNNSSNTLADVAAYYWATDLRTDALGNCTGAGGANVCENNVPPSGVDTSVAQHMTTFTLGLGASGFMQFRSDYRTAASGDYFAVANGLTANPTAGICNWQSSGTCNWPVPSSNTLTTIDDLWHAAVNGRGSYFSAGDPASLFTGLKSALEEIDTKVGAAAAATTSNPNVSSGDNYVFISNYVSGDWIGQLVGTQVNLDTGAVLSTAGDWKAADQLASATGRSIYTFDASVTTTKLKSFDWDSLSAAEKSNFALAHITATGNALSQFCSFGTTCLSSAAQSDAAGKKLVDFVRGVRTDEGEEADVSRYFRKRGSEKGGGIDPVTGLEKGVDTVLGDIVNSEAVYVQKSLFNYADAGYGSYKTSIASRTPMVYVGANDGMLHAFDAQTGAEVWAYVPTMVIPNLYKLADKDYANRHQFYVDATPTVADVKISGEWRTVLVGGLGAGGKGYYALDVTDPQNPRALWEFTHANLGFTYGRPEVTKLKDGTWVVIFASGYNNSGNDRLFVLNAATGAAITAINGNGQISTGVATGGLAQIRAWVQNPDVDNTTLRVYAGDNGGNVWRFDVNGDVGATGYDAQLLATLKGPGGLEQPVTSRPELALVYGAPVVYVGTGRYLGLSDLNDDSPQTIYAIKDKLGTTSYGNPRKDDTFVEQTLTVSTCPSNTSVCTAGQEVRTGSSNTVNISTQSGWYMDLPLKRERASTDPQLALGTLVVTSNVINPNACSVGGESYINFLDYRTGAPVATANGVVSVFLGNAVATRPTVIRLPSGKIVSLTRLADDRTVVSPVPVSTPGGPTRRLSWRELAVEQ